MKRLIAGIAIMCAAAVAGPAFAQDTIKVSDVSTQFAVGSVTQPRWDSTVTSINIGRPGSSSWDFSGLIRSNVVTFTSTAVTGAPFATSFQGATHMLKGDINYLLNGTPIPATVYWYFQLSSTGLLNLGKGANATLGGLPASAVETSKPADTFYKLPSTLGTTWTSAYLDTTAVYVFGSWQVGFGTYHNASYLVDAYGPLTIPGGSVHQVLRIKKTDTTTSGTTTSRGVGYIFLGKDGTLITLGGSNPDAPDSGTIAVNPPVQWAAPVNTSAPVAAAAPVKFSLEQNYPNPFNPSTVISYAVPVRSNVRLAVYNLLGQIVAELVNGDVQAGSHSVEWHPMTSSGMYLCRIDAVALDNPAASFSKVLKMAYIK